MNEAAQLEKPSGLRRDAPLRVLIVRVGAMGDVLHGLPAVAGLRNALPQCFIGWAVEPHWAPLLVGSGGGALVDRVHEVPTRAWRKRPFALQTGAAIRELTRDLRSERYDVCLDLQGSIKSAVVGRMAGAPQFFGPARPREWAAGMLYGEGVEVRSAHVAEQACELLRTATGLALQQAVVQLPAEPEAEEWCAALLARLGVQQPFALLAPAAGWGAKEWGLTQFAQVATLLQSAGYTVLVNAAGQDGIGRETADTSQAVAVESTLPQLIALVRRAALVLGGDTGPVHLGAALGRPTLALFGPTDPARNGPWFPGATARVLRHANSGTTYKRHPQTEAGLARLSVDEVTEAALGMLQGGAHG